MILFVTCLKFLPHPFLSLSRFSVIFFSGYNSQKEQIPVRPQRLKRHFGAVQQINSQANPNPGAGGDHRALALPDPRRDPVDKKHASAARGLYCQVSSELAPWSQATGAAAAELSPRVGALPSSARAAGNGPVSASSNGTSNNLTCSPLLTVAATLGPSQSLPENNLGANVQETRFSESSPKSIFYRGLRRSLLPCCPS